MSYGFLFYSSFPWLITLIDFGLLNWYCIAKIKPTWSWSIILVYQSIWFAQSLSHVQFSVTPWNVAHQTPLFMEFTGKNTGMCCHFYSREYCWHRDQTHVSCVSCIGRWFLHTGTPEKSFFFFFFNCRLITLQYCGGFCHTFTWL